MVDLIGFEFVVFCVMFVVVVIFMDVFDFVCVVVVMSLFVDEGVFMVFFFIFSDFQVLLSLEWIWIMCIFVVGILESVFVEDVVEYQVWMQGIFVVVSILLLSMIQFFMVNVDFLIVVCNDLLWLVMVQFFVLLIDFCFEVKFMIEIEVQVNLMICVKVLVLVCVGSGEVIFWFNFYSFIGVFIQGDQLVRVVVCVEWEVIGFVIFGGFMVLLIVFGVICMV